MTNRKQIMMKTQKSCKEQQYKKFLKLCTNQKELYVINSSLIEDRSDLKLYIASSNTSYIDSIVSGLRSRDIINNAQTSEMDILIFDANGIRINVLIPLAIPQDPSFYHFIFIILCNHQSFHHVSYKNKLFVLLTKLFVPSNLLISTSPPNRSNLSSLYFLL